MMGAWPWTSPRPSPRRSPLRLVSQVGIEPTTRGLKVPCSATELLARTLAPDSTRITGALRGFFLLTLGAAGDVQGGGKREHERRQHTELGDEVQEPLRVV